MPKEKESKTLTARDMYKEFPLKKEIPYKLFKEILSEFNKEAINMILKAKGISIGALGFIKLRKIRRNFNKKVVDWGNSVKGEDGKYTKLAFFTDPYYIRYAWVKNYGFCRIKEHKFFTFKPTEGRVNDPYNNKRKLVNALKSNPVLHFKIPYTSSEKIYLRIDPKDLQILDTYDDKNKIPELQENPGAMRNIRRALNNPSLTAYGFNWKVIVK